MLTNHGADEREAKAAVMAHPMETDLETLALWILDNDDEDIIEEYSSKYEDMLNINIGSEESVPKTISERTIHMWKKAKDSDEKLLKGKLQMIWIDFINII